MLDRKQYIDLDAVLKRVAHYFDQALQLDYIRNPMAWALYQAWKDVDEGKIGGKKE